MRKIQVFISLIIVTFLFIFLGSNNVNYEAAVETETLYINGTPVQHYNYSGSGKPVTYVQTTKNYVERESEFRAAFVSTAWNIDIIKCNKEAEYKSAFITLCNTILAKNMNVMLFQVRPMNDAWYDSIYSPWSSYASGAQGTSAGWDAMAWMVEYCHSRGIEFHAWMNPFRVGNKVVPMYDPVPDKTAFLNGLHSTNYARIHKDRVIVGKPSRDTTKEQDTYNYILNPGDPNVREYLADVVAEVLELYDVDGIHFDDYFYPYSGTEASEDAASYNEHKLQGETLNDFRRRSVNLAIKGVKDVVEEHNSTNNKNAKFGVSPFGVWKSQRQGYPEGANVGYTNQSYVQEFADVKAWIENQWIHYVAPQIYWAFTHSSAPYADCIDWWAGVCEANNVPLIISHSLSSQSNWGDQELSRQINYNNKYDIIKGSAFFSTRNFGTSQVSNVVSNYWKNAPTKVWEDDVPIDVPTYTLSGIKQDGVFIDDVTVDASSSYDIYYRIGNTGDFALYDKTNKLVLMHNGTVTVQMYAKYGAKLSETISFDCLIRRQFPNPAISLSGEKENDVFVSDVTVTVTSIHPVRYKIGDAGTWTTYTDPFILTHKGSITVYVQAKDGDIESEIVEQVVYIDRSVAAPTYTLSGEKENDVFINDVTLTAFSFLDIYYKVEGDLDFTRYIDPIVFDHDGSITVYLIARLGSRESELVTIEISIVRPPLPIITIDIEGVGSSDYYQSAIITLQTNNDYYDIIYKINDGNQAVYEEALTIDKEGTYTIYYKADDNRATYSSKTIHIDITPPSLPVVKINGNKDELDVYTEAVEIEMESVVSVTFSYRVYLNSTAITNWTTYENSFSLTENGNYRIQLRAEDLARNVSTSTRAEDITLEIFVRVSENNTNVVRDGNIVNYYGTNTPVTLVENYLPKDEEVRAVWLELGTDIPVISDIEVYKKAIKEIFVNLQSLNFNVALFQIRKINDAYYESDYAPYSRYLAGVEGKNPEFDALAFVIETAHEYGIELHAWLNPYQVSNNPVTNKDEYLNGLDENNFARKNKEYVMTDKNNYLWLNPGYVQVQTYLVDICDELLEKYSIDGIHFDDSFYSPNDYNDSEDADEYRNNNGGLSLTEWRKSNIDGIIERIRDSVSSYNDTKKQNVKFGVTAFTASTVIINSENEGYANQDLGVGNYSNSEKWVKDELVDYVVPKSYYGFSLGFADIVKWWAELASEKDVKIIVAQGLCREVNGNLDWTDQSELLEQIRFASQFASVFGFSIYSYSNLLSDNPNVVSAIERLKNNYYKTPAEVPWESEINEEGFIITLNNDDTRGIVSGINKDKYQAGEKVTIKVTPNEGYQLDYIRIGNERYSSLEITITINSDLDVRVIYKVASANNSFNINDYLLWIIGGGVVILGISIFAILKAKNRKKEK